MTDCAVCGVPLEGHHRCAKCGILLGSKHWYTAKHYQGLTLDAACIEWSKRCDAYGWVPGELAGAPAESRT